MKFRKSTVVAISSIRSRKQRLVAFEAGSSDWKHSKQEAIVAISNIVLAIRSRNIIISIVVAIVMIVIVTVMTIVLIVIIIVIVIVL